MSKRNVASLLSAKPTVPHRALTGYIKRRCPDSLSVRGILTKCDTPGRLGALPSELRGQVDKKNLSSVTAEFTNILTPFLTSKMAEFKKPVTMTYLMLGLNELFGTPCQLTTRAVTKFSFGWSGLWGTVIKMEFPDLGASYALKVFYKSKISFSQHGAKPEVVTAFAANQAEAKDNNPVYLAYWGDVSYMLSKWAGDDEDNHPCRYNENEIFVTSSNEIAPRNYRDGKRIDFGATIRTAYGSESYAVRKLYRKIVNVCQRKDINEFYEIYGCDGNITDAMNLKRATELVKRLMPYKKYNKKSVDFFNICMQCADIIR